MRHDPELGIPFYIPIRYLLEPLLILKSSIRSRMQLQPSGLVAGLHI
jgi:hypothetical protein